LMTAEQVQGMSMRPRFTIVSREGHPLEIFGREASQSVRDLLDVAGIRFVGGVDAEVERHGRVVGGGAVVTAERVVTIPVLDGPRMAGLPAAAYGFIPVDAVGHVRDTPDVYAAGDATDRLIKQGGLACQQADTIAQDVARRAGAPVPDAEPAPTI